MSEIPTLHYEKDLMGMKYRILISKRHDAVVSELAEMSGVTKQIMRSALIHRADMMLLEALPPRYHAYHTHTQTPPSLPSKGEDEAKYILRHIIPILSAEEEKSTIPLATILRTNEKSP